VQKFSIGHHHFFRLNIEGSADFYELVRPGRVSFLVRRSKKIEEKIQYDALQHFITIHDSYFLGIDGQYHPFSSENSLLKLLEDKKKPIRQFMRSQDIKYNDDPERAISEILDFYNQQPR
jgi:hypothetical protein